MGLADHARQMVAYNEWANNKVLDALSALREQQYAAVAPTLTHLLGTQKYWYANWTGADFGDEGDPLPLEMLRTAYAGSHDELRAHFAQLTDDDWHRADQWWKRWGYEQTLPVGETLFQVVNHSTQHRSEVAATISGFGASPGDLDYLVFKQGLA